MKYNKNKEFSEIKRTFSGKKNFCCQTSRKYGSGPQPVSMILNHSFSPSGRMELLIFIQIPLLVTLINGILQLLCRLLFSTINDSLHRDLYDGLLWFVLETALLNGKSLPVPLSTKCVIPMQKIPGSGIKPFQTAVDGSEQYCLCIAGRKMSYYSRAGYRACLHKREKTFQRTYLKLVLQPIRRSSTGSLRFFNNISIQWTAGQTYFSLSLFHASKEETSESLSFTYCPK